MGGIHLVWNSPPPHSIAAMPKGERGVELLTLFHGAGHTLDTKQTGFRAHPVDSSGTTNLPKSRTEA